MGSSRGYFEKLKGTWHHASFDEQTGEFVMQLVERAPHEALDHTGAYAKYLDWAAEVIRRQRFGGLSADQKLALPKVNGVRIRSRRVQPHFA